MGTLTGRVVQSGKPVSHYALMYRSSDPSHRPSRIEVRDAHGRFTLHNLDAGLWHLQIGAAGARVHVTEEILVTDFATVDIGDIALARGAGFAGTVRDRNGKPVRRARVTVGDNYLAFMPSGDMEPVDLWLSGWFDTKTDDAGRFVYDGTASQRQPTLIRADHDELGQSLIRAVMPGESTVDLELRPTGAILAVVEQPGPYRGLIATRSDEPVRRFNVGGPGNPLLFARLPVGDYEVSLGVPSVLIAPTARVTVAEGEMSRVAVPLPVRLADNVQVKVQVPVGRAHDVRLVSVRTGASARRGGISLAPIINGRIEAKHESVTFEDVEPGAYRATFDGITWFDVSVETSSVRQRIVLPRE